MSSLDKMIASFCKKDETVLSQEDKEFIAFKFITWFCMFPDELKDLISPKGPTYIWIQSFKYLELNITYRPLTEEKPETLTTYPYVSFLSNDKTHIGIYASGKSRQMDFNEFFESETFKNVAEKIYEARYGVPFNISPKIARVPIGEGMFDTHFTMKIKRCD